MLLTATGWLKQQIAISLSKPEPTPQYDVIQLISKFSVIQFPDIGREIPVNSFLISFRDCFYRISEAHNQPPIIFSMKRIPDTQIGI